MKPEGDPEDIQWTLTTYKAADYDENGSEATPLAEVEKWNSRQPASILSASQTDTSKAV